MTEPDRSSEPVDQRFVELRASGSIELRNALIEAHLELARNLARRYRHTPQPLEDLEQVASLALVKAVDGFDPSRGSPFIAYAVPTILGELKRHMRAAAWAVRVPRSLQERVLAVDRAERSLATRLGAAPTVQQLAEEAGVSVEATLEALAARLAHDADPLDAVDPNEREAESALRTPDDFRDAVEDRLSLSHALRRLPERERTILRLRFVEGLTQTEIAAKVGLSQMYVSRLLRTILERLREEIERPPA